MDSIQAIQVLDNHITILGAAALFCLASIWILLAMLVDHFIYKSK